MNREIKFRAWDKVLNEHLPNIQNHLGNDEWAFVNILKENGNRYIVEQFTGLHDKNGVEIYEGDILSKVSISELGGLIQYFYLVFWSSSDQGFKTKQYVLDENEEGSYWRIKNEGIFDSLVMVKTYNHVVGNIHLNPELIK